jgi:hypothetical protein
VAKKGFGVTGVDAITDALWLPTEREMFGTASRSTSYENAANQARLEYYETAGTRTKYFIVDGDCIYWEASPEGTTSSNFAYVNYGGSAFYGQADSLRGVAPAFCVK